MKEKTIVKILFGRSVKGQSEFTNYENALAYARCKSDEGYSCLILRFVDGKEWVKFWLTPSETL